MKYAIGTVLIHVKHWQKPRCVIAGHEHGRNLVKRPDRVTRVSDATLDREYEVSQ